MKLLLSTLNCSYIHKNLALRWLYVAAPEGFDVTIKEFTIKQDIYKMVEYYLQCDADWVGFSVYIYNVELLKEIIEQLKLRRPGLKIILGGPEVSYEWDEWWDYGVDAIVAGEGEQVLYEFLAHGQADGVHTREYTPQVGYAISDLQWLQSLTSPYFLEFDLWQLYHQYFYFETSRGCPYRCSYCLSSNDQSVRKFDQSYVKAQLAQLMDHPVKQVKFLDRTFNLDDELALGVAEQLELLPYPMSAQMELVVDSLSPRLLEFFLKKASVERYRFEIGVQSFNVQTLNAVRRYHQHDRLVNNIRLLRQRGYVLHVDLIAGLPYEGLDSFAKGFDQLAQLEPSEIQVGILKLLRGTTLKQQRDEYQLVYNHQAPYQVLSTPWLSSEELGVINRVYQACEKLYNNGRMLRTLGYLQNRFDGSMFWTLAAVGEVLLKMVPPYQPYQLMHEVLKAFGDDPWLRAYLNEDYYHESTMKLKRLFPLALDQHQQVLANQRWLRQVSQMELFHYGMMYQGVDNQQLVDVLYVYRPEHIRRIVMEQPMKEIVVASHNQHKIQEYQEMLTPLGYHVLDLRTLKVDWEVEETGQTFQENAWLKAYEMAKYLNLPVLADDSGLQVKALDNAPGIYSARYLGVDTPYSVKNQWIIDQLQTVDDRQAQFVCVIAYALPNGQGAIFEGLLSGTISHEPRGIHGFGYDPIFQLADGRCVAELSSDEKHQISHRAIACCKFIEYLKEQTNDE